MGAKYGTKRMWIKAMDVHTGREYEMVLPRGGVDVLQQTAIEVFAKKFIMLGVKQILYCLMKDSMM
eukprot:NODE_2884_length_453_cov_194.816832_g2285_i0.p1 GENE.NODE_2884_length_453_cov_194.816832_g2285_i0~~NODE_2884_length_453_cov_194.816832_g2285_i0.p1  ORF type:complete len:66 (+),score=15.74 NODE_2884_length_453_cov_194.816832_g2285_i0:31-228(+)